MRFHKQPLMRLDKTRQCCKILAIYLAVRRSITALYSHRLAHLFKEALFRADNLAVQVERKK